MHEFDTHRQFMHLWKEALVGKPFVDQQGTLLSLYFDISAIQSQMNVEDPTELVLPYSQLMMGFWLFQPAPQRIGMVGLGGGSLVKFIHRYLPEARLDVAELNPDVIAMREQFCVPPDDARLQVHCLDGAVMVRHLPAQLGAPLDALLLDGYSADGIPHALSTPAFFEHCRNALGEHGMLVANLSADEHRGDACLQRMRRTFRNVVAVPSDDGGNRVVFATRGPALSTPSEALTARAEAIRQHSRLDLRGLVKELMARLPAPPTTPCPSTTSAG